MQHDDVTLAFRAPGGGGGVVLWTGPLVDGERNAVAVDVETSGIVGAVAVLLADGGSEGATTIVTIRAATPGHAATAA